MKYSIYIGENKQFRKFFDRKEFNEFDSKEDATNFIVEFLIEKFKNENKEIDSTFFDELNEFEIDSIYDCECCC